MDGATSERTKQLNRCDQEAIKHRNPRRKRAGVTSKRRQRPIARVNAYGPPFFFAVTPGVDVVALRKRAEAALLDVRCHDGSGDDPFAGAAQTSSIVLPAGGRTRMALRTDCAPEFAREIFGRAE